MNQLEKELQRIREKLNEMWALVEFQVHSGKEALLSSNMELTKEIRKKGKKVNAYDVKIDWMCESLFALYNPVAIDLRWVLATLKINANLERIGDSAESIARLIQEMGPPEAELLKVSRVIEMYDAAIGMLSDVHKAFNEEDSELARQLIKQDKLLDKIHRKTDGVILAYIKSHPENIGQSLKASGIIRRLERIGDQITNIAEEIVFSIDAKVLKHHQKDKKNKDNQ